MSQQALTDNGGQSHGQKGTMLMQALHTVRIAPCTPYSLDDPVEGDRGLSLGETVSLDDWLFRTGRISRPQADLLDLSIDVRRAIDAMPPNLRRVCRALSSLSVAEVAKDLRLRRSTLAVRMEEIKTFLLDRGINHYVCGNMSSGHGRVRP